VGGVATESVQLDGGRTLCVERFGRVDGKPVLYFHGLPGRASTWFGPMRCFAARGLAVVAVDRPGFGGSSFERRRALLDWPGDVDALADRLGLERFAVVATRVAANTGSPAPRRCRSAYGTVTATTSFRRGTRATWRRGSQRARLTVMERVGHLLREQLDPIVRELASGGVS
jgi:alpha/beta hydrolase family protein